MKRIYWMLGIILSPILLAFGIIFFSIVAVVIIAIAMLVGLLAFIIYLNKRFKYIVYKIKNNSRHAENPGHTSKRTEKEHEVVIEHVEEREKNDKE